MKKGHPLKGSHQNSQQPGAEPVIPVEGREHFVAFDPKSQASSPYALIIFNRQLNAHQAFAAAISPLHEEWEKHGCCGPQPVDFLGGITQWMAESKSKDREDYGVRKVGEETEEGLWLLVDHKHPRKSMRDVGEFLRLRAYVTDRPIREPFTGPLEQWTSRGRPFQDEAFRKGLIVLLWNAGKSVGQILRALEKWKLPIEGKNPKQLVQKELKGLRARLDAHTVFHEKDPRRGVPLSTSKPPRPKFFPKKGAKKRGGPT